jgi:lysophospholipase L1-like esterase
MKRIILGALFLSNPVFAQSSEELKVAMKPFWKGKIMYNESVMMVAKDGAPPEARLLFKPKKILRVSNAGQTEQYVKGKDWEYKDGTLRLLPNSNAVFMTEQELYPDSTKKSFPKNNGGRILFSEGSFFHEKQIAVTYKHAAKPWKGHVPVFQGDALPKSLQKLNTKSEIHILLNGDSIAAGANASGASNVAPNLPSWGALLAAHLRLTYQAPVKFTNTAVGGMSSDWGMNNVDNLINKHSPDLVIIAFGMNDGTGKISPEKFKSNIQTMIARVRAKKPDTEFILVSTMLPNPESKFVGTQKDFQPVLKSLLGPGIALADLTQIHEELLKKKKYQDMTGNNINHPNDFLIRWYAQELAGLLIP